MRRNLSTCPSTKQFRTFWNEPRVRPIILPNKLGHDLPIRSEELVRKISIIGNGNRTEWSPQTKSDHRAESHLFITSIITD